jgi:periplasmic divalent cation tolerance protein
MAIAVVLTNLPDRDAAVALARALVDRHLAACVNVMAGCTSIYRWQGAIESAEEVPVLIKTRMSLVPQVQAAICELHPYELPEVVALPVEAGLEAYLAWVEAETTSARG